MELEFLKLKLHKIFFIEFEFVKLELHGKLEFYKLKF